MKTALDASVVVAALHEGDSSHAACHRLLSSGRHSIHAHALTEIFSTLTGGRLGVRITARDAAAILRDRIVPRLAVTALETGELVAAYEDSERRGIRGGAIYDFLHLAAARKAGAKRFYTLNARDFLAFQREGDPEIVLP